jgi:predicted nucleotidyltransferase component of viral defense system
MHEIVDQMLKKYACKSLLDYENALKEIIQEIALLGLWRAKFFEEAAFYGGTALRILHGLPRFSEDMDFSLLKPNPDFDISKYQESVRRELAAYNFEVSIEKKIKQNTTSIDSAFIKANTMIHLLKVNSNFKTHKDSLLKIKLEVDTTPPDGANTAVQSHFSPIPFSVKTFDLPSLFAGKIAATLYRPYKINVKGRDWFDFLWYISRGTNVNVNYFKSISVQLKKWPVSKTLGITDIVSLLEARIEEVDLSKIKADVLPFVKDKDSVNAWTIQLFTDSFQRLVK